MICKKIHPIWYVLHTRSRFENVAYTGLDKKSFEVFLPKLTVRSKRRDRKKMIKVPLFPGYLFVRSDLTQQAHLEIVQTVGVVRILGNKGGPFPVPEATIESLRIMVNTDEQIATGNRFKKGDRVVVVSGPFTGVQGFFSRYRGRGRIVVDIEALGQYASVDVDEEDVEMLPKIIS